MPANTNHFAGHTPPSCWQSFFFPCRLIGGIRHTLPSRAAGSALAGGAEADRSAWGFFCSFSLFQFLPQPSLPGAPCCDLPLNQPITSASIQNHTAESVWKHNSLCEAPQHRKVRVGTRTHTAFPLFKCSFFRARNLKPLFFWLSRSAGAQLPLASPAFPPFSVRLM